MHCHASEHGYSLRERTVLETKLVKRPLEKADVDPAPFGWASKLMSISHHGLSLIPETFHDLQNHVHVALRRLADVVVKAIHVPGQKSQADEKDLKPEA